MYSIVSVSYTHLDVYKRQLEQLTDMTKEFDSFDDWQEQKEKYLSLIHIYRKIISLW